MTGPSGMVSDEFILFRQHAHLNLDICHLLFTFVLLSNPQEGNVDFYRKSLYFITRKHNDKNR